MSREITYNLANIEEQYGIKLDNAQVSALSNLINFITDSEDNKITIAASAGSGKTTIIKIFYEIASDNGYYTCIITPTNKSKSVFCNGEHVKTIHSLLNLCPDLDILEFDASKLQFNLFNDLRKEPNYDILIVDECSMINRSLYNLLADKYKHKKIIFSGDPKQLACIEDNKLSKTFDNKQITLPIVHRQSNGIVYKVIDYLRNKPIFKFKSISDNNGQIIVYDNIINMINKNYHLFKLAGDMKEINLVKLVTFSNKRINALNQLIRSKLYNNKDEYHSREIVTGYDTYRVDNIVFIENSVDYFVNSVTKQNINNKYPGYLLSLESCNGSNIITIHILSRNISDKDLNELAEKLESLRLKAYKSKSKLDWRKFFDLYESFATPIDITYNGRIIKRKTLDYGYCISAYKSQGSTYNIAMIDMENLFRYANGEKLRQLQYVACSRTSSDLIIYQRD